MKKLFLVIALCGFTMMASAQEEKPVSDKKVSPEMVALQTATSLAKYGYATFSPSSLAEAARILSTTNLQDLSAKPTRGASQEQASKQCVVSFEPAQLIADAKKYANNDKAILSYIKQVEKSIASAPASTRGAVGGPKYAQDRVYGKDYVQYQVKFWAGELAEIIVVGDGDNDLDLYVYDQNGNLIASDADYTDQCVCRWVPAWTGTFTIRIVNRGAIYSNYAIATN